MATRFTNDDMNDTRATRPRRPPLPWSLRILRFTVRAIDTASPSLAALLAERLWRHAPRYRTPRHEAAWLADAKTSTLPFGGHPLALYSWGTGPTVILVHGWSGRGSQLGAFVAPLTAAGYRVVAFDAPAHGRSPGRYTSALEIARALRAVVDARGPAHGVIAHSFGGLATLIALHDGLHVERAVCVSAPASAEALFSRYTRRLGLSPRAIALLRRRTERRFGDEIWTRTDNIRLATHARIPGLMIHDRDDRDVPWEEGAAIARAWTGADWLLTEGLGHRRILRDPAVIARVVEFIKRQC